MVVVYSRVGGGHLSAARALATELEATGACRVRLVDAYLDCGRFPVTRFPAIYANLASRHPRLWSLIYHTAEQAPRGGLKPSLIVGPFLRGGFKRLILEERPDAVIGVLPAINEVLAWACRSVGARLEVVLTDWNKVHPMWVARGVDHYTTPTDAARLDCIRYGAAPESVDVIGIPVRREFDPGADSVALLSKSHRKSGAFTILAMVGAEGSPRALRNISGLANSSLDAELQVVCGRSERLRQAIAHLPARMPVHALGYVENVAGLMRSADVLLTKAGGLTLAEAFCCGVPVVVHDVVPGQEAGNLEYVLGQGAAEYAASPESLVGCVARLQADPERAQQLAARGARLARPHAARDIAANVLQRL